MERSSLPFYFPTNAVLVDDDINFLKHFSLLLDPRLPCRTYSSAAAALEQINGQTSLLHSFAEITNVAVADDTEEHIYVDFNKIHNLVYDDERFSQITIAIIDYDMPEMNGLEVCKKIHHPEIKKILLTGKADEKLAVEAFNAGLIDQFIQKGNTDVDKQLNKAIDKLQLEYFMDITSPVHMAIIDSTASFLNDGNFHRKFSGLIKEKNIIEFYLWDNPRGLLMLDEYGNSGFMFVMSEEVLNTHYDMVETCEAPAELLKLIKNGGHLPWFPTTDGYYTSDCLPDWRNYLHEVDFNCGRKENNLCSFVSPAPPDTLDNSRILPFQSYLKAFDEKHSLSS